MIMQDVGSAVFIKYYEYFKNKESSECIALIEENYTMKSKRSRTYKAKQIFDRELQLEALEYIASSDKVSPDIIKRANELLKV